jgi:FtsH-binding integral membrane protein
MKENLKSGQKEKNLFFANANVSITGSLIAGLVGASFYDLVNLFGISKEIRIIYSIIFVIILLIIIFFFKSRIKKI